MRFLPQILGVEAQAGIRMKDFGPGKPLCSETSQVLPRHPAFLAATLQHPQPAFAYFTPSFLGAAGSAKTHDMVARSTRSAETVSAKTIC